MKNLKLFAVALAFLLVHVSAAAAAEKNYLPSSTPESAGLSSKKLAEIDTTVQQMIADDKIAGAVTVIVRDGKVVYEKAFGKRDRKRDKPMEIDTVFRIYSMTKPIVSVAAMILRDEGKFKLDDPVSNYIPEFKGLQVYKSGSGDSIELVDVEREMTVRDLLRHTSGLTYGIFGNSVVDQMYRKANVLGQRDLKSMAKEIGKLPLQYSPGDRWLYSVSSDVLGYFVQVVAKKPLDKFLRQRVFRPLGMRDTSFFVAEKKQKRFASVYGPSAAGLRMTEDAVGSRFTKNPTMFSGGGGLTSTARDYVRFCQMLAGKGELNGKRILKASTVEEMTKDHLPKKAFPIAFGAAKRVGVGFGLGFSVNVKPPGRQAEYGWGGAASTHFWISPKDNLFGVTMSQHQPYNDRLERAIKPIVYDAIKK